VTTFNPNQPVDIQFHVLDISTPASPSQIGALDSAGGYDVHLVDTSAFCSGDQYNEFRIVSIADSAHPSLVGTGVAPGANWGVWASANGAAAFIAGRSDGMSIFDVANPASPALDTSLLAMDRSADVSVKGGLVAIAGDASGLVMLSVQDPVVPEYLGRYDTLGELPHMESAVLADSFAFVSFYSRAMFRSVCVSDPARPMLAGVESAAVDAKDMVLRDVLLYKVSVRNLQVVDVSRPREPVLAGSCTSTDGLLFGLVLQDSLAYEVSAFGLWIINIARPDSPYVVSSTQDRLTAAGLAVRDTFAFIPSSHESLWVYSVANPAAPYPLAAMQLRSRGYDIVLVDTLAWIGEVSGVEILSVADPVRPRSVTFSSTPYLVRRLTCQAPYVFAAMSEAGVAVFDSLLVGLAETPAVRLGSGLRLCVQPSVTRTEAVVSAQSSEQVLLQLCDVAGRVVPGRVQLAAGHDQFLLHLGGMPDGVYFLRGRTRTEVQTAKIVKQQ